MKLNAFVSSTIGKKTLIALTGLFMVLFLLLHLGGNLQIFFGPDSVNSYAAFLRSIPTTLWIFRITLIIAVIVHLYLTVTLSAKNQQARREKNQLKRSRKASVASRTMMFTGLTILAFVLYHLAQYTFGITNPEFMTFVDKEGRHDVYRMMVMGFQSPYVSGFYVLALTLLAFHLIHGVSSTVRTLGFQSREAYENIRVAGGIFAVAVAILYISIPVAVLMGALPLDY